METKRLWALRIGGGILALLLQISLAPFISLGLTTPNFIAAWCIASTMANPSRPPLVSALLLGIAFDVLGGGPVGAMAFSLMVVTFAASRVFMVVSNDTVFMTVAFICASALLVELLYGVIVAAVTPAFAIGQALIYRSLPNGLYDFVVAVICYPIVAFAQTRLLSQNADLPVI